MMVRRLLRACLCGVVLLATLLLGPVVVEADPFAAGRADESHAASPAEPSLLQRLGARLVLLQRDINRLITRQMVAIKSGQSDFAIYVGLAIAFLYGAAHAAGPGHGKAVIVSYFLSRDGGFLKGVWMGGQIALFHVVAAIILVSAAHVALQTTLSRPVDELQALKVVSYGIITAVGLWMFGTTLWRRLIVAHSGRADDHDKHGHGHSHCHGCAAATARRQGGLLSLAVGLVPCSGAVLILVYSLANGILFSGILMTLSIGLGMAVTLSAIGFASIYARREALAIAARGNRRRGDALQTTLALAGSLLIAGFGGFLLAGTL